MQTKGGASCASLYIYRTQMNDFHVFFGNILFKSQTRFNACGPAYRQHRPSAIHLERHYGLTASM